jgi:hypothetical protein
MWSLALVLRVRDHVLVFARSQSVVVSQGTSGGSYGNYKCRDHAFKCSVRDDIVVEMLDDDNPGEGGGQS